MLKTLAYAAPAAKASLAPYSFERREPKEHDVVIDIKYCGICHTDVHQVRDEWGGGIFPMVPGHEIVGVVTRVGSHVGKFKVGDKVGVGCLVDSCRICDHCRDDLEQYCTGGFSATYSGHEQDGKTVTQGGYSDKIVVDENYVLRVPDNLPLDAAAPLLCAGITLYSPLKHWKAGPGKNVAIVGLGGLGHMGVKIAHALGAEVTVLSHSLKSRPTASGSAPTISSLPPIRRPSRNSPARSISSSAPLGPGSTGTSISGCSNWTARWSLSALRRNRFRSAPSR